MGDVYSSWSSKPIGKVSRSKKIKAKLWMLTHPYVSITPASSSGVKLSIDRTKYGFILWIPGKQYKKCGKRIHVSWRH